MTTIDLRVLGIAARMTDEAAAGHLLAWRGRMQAALNLPDSAVTFIVPPGLLAGWTDLGGSQVVHRQEVDRPMVAVTPPGW